MMSLEDDAESIDYLPSEEIFTELARMRYEKPSTKLTFYKVFFSAQWKFLIHTILQCMSSKRKTWNKFSSSMASAVICLATCRKFNFLKYIFDSLVAPTPPPSLVAQPSSPPQQPQPSQPTTISTKLLNTLLETYTTLTIRVENLEQDKIAQDLEITKLKQRVRRLEKRNKVKASGLKRLKKVLSMQDDKPEPSELKEVIEVVTTAKLMTEVVIAAITTIIDVPSAARRRKGVVIQDPEETATPSTIVHSEPKSKDKGKGIMVQEPKPLKKQPQIEQDEYYARDIEEETTDRSLARKNMMVYLKNMAGFKMDYFKGMSYDDIRPIFEKYFNSDVAFLVKSKEHLEEEESRALKRQSESSEEKAAKKQKLDEKVEDLKKHLQIVPNDDDEVYTKATPLALNVPVVDYEIYSENNKPYYKIIRADGSHQLFLSFLSLLRNFDRENLEVLWQIVKERFASLKPNNFLDDFLLTTLKAMFEKPDVEA
nr:synaptobrevin, longin-like domain protein [Tanacetum cinerariifolium]